MDDLFQLRHNMTQKDFQLFTQDRLEKVAEEDMQMTAGRLQENYAEELEALVSAQVKLDMPPQDADEKESTRQRRERGMLEKHAKTLYKNRSQEREQQFQEKLVKIKQSGQLDLDAGGFFTTKLHEEEFSPRYVLEHFAEVRQRLDDLREEIAFYDNVRTQTDALPLEYQMQLEEIRRMHENAEGAVTSALAAMGYQYEQVKSGKIRFTKIQDPERIADEKNHNLECRRNIKEIAENADEKVADQLIESSQQSLKPSYEQLREEMKKDQNYSFIPSDHLTDAHQFEVIKEVKDLMAGHPDEYRKNKEVLDKMYQEVFRLMEINGTLDEHSAAIKNISDDIKMAPSNQMHRILTRRQEVSRKKMNLIQNCANDVIEGMRYLLNTIGNDQLSNRSRLMIREFRKQPDFTRQSVEMIRKAGAYARMLGERQEAFSSEIVQNVIAGNAYLLESPEESRSFAVFMEPEQKEHNVQMAEMFQNILTVRQDKLSNKLDNAQYNKRVGGIVKPIFTHYLNKMDAFDTKELESCTDEELLERAEELQEMDLQREKLIDAAKYTDPEDREGRSILDARYSDDYSRMLFDLKCSLVHSYALRARSLARIRAYKMDSLTSMCFTKDEEAQLIGDHETEYRRDSKFAEKLMLIYAKRELERSEALKDAAYNSYFHSDVVHTKYISKSVQFPKLDEGHSTYQHKLQEAEEAGVAELKRLEAEQAGAAEPKLQEAEQTGVAEPKLQEAEKKQFMSDTEIETYYNILKDQISEIWEELEKEDIDEERASKLEATRKELDERRGYLQDLYALTKKHYKLSGSSDDLINEAIFRSYNPIESQPSFHNMSDEEFQFMCRQLSAGALDQKTATEKQRQRYREQNVRGLLLYKKHMSDHYEMLEERFNHKLPSLVYIDEHRDELQKYFANVQVDINLVEHSRDMIDTTKPEDARLFHLVSVYNAMALYISGLTALMPDKTRDYKKTEDSCRTVVRNEKASFDYLDANPRQL